MNNFIAGHWLPGHFVGLKLGSDVPEHNAPLRRCQLPISSFMPEGNELDLARNDQKSLKDLGL